MIKGSEVIGKPVVSYSDGKELERVQDLVFDAENGVVLALLVDQGGWFSEAHVLPLTDIREIGEDAVIIDDAKQIVSAADLPRIQEVLEGSNALKGTKVLTEDGKDLGKLVDLSFDAHTGMVKEYEVSGGILADVSSGRATIPAPKTLKIGKDVAFVSSEVAQDVENQKGGLAGVAQSAGEKVHGLADSAKQGGKEMMGAAGEKAEDLKEKATSPETKDKVATGLDHVKEVAGNLYDKAKEKVTEAKEYAQREAEEHKVKGAVGKPASRVVSDKQDQVIVNTGDLITYGAIEKARSAGVLDVLLSSVYDHEPKLTTEQMKAPART